MLIMFILFVVGPAILIAAFAIGQGSGMPPSNGPFPPFPGPPSPPRGHINRTDQMRSDATNLGIDTRFLDQ